MHSSSPDARIDRDEDAIAHRVLAPADLDYPARLKELSDAPAQLWVQGSLDHALPPAVAIVGTRVASAYGVRTARAIASACARAGVSVISGLARGIDGVAHTAALSASGRTVAVLGTGIGIHYPRQHRELQRRIATEGMVVSELPPMSTGHGGSFPQRNRLIAALADVTVVVEAGEKSGALITARHALELGRTVACVPNAIDVPSAFGSNALLKSGAEPILSPDDVLAMLALRATPAAPPALSGDCAVVWDAVCAGAPNTAAVARHANLSVRAATVALSMLEIEGLVAIDLLGDVRPLVNTRGI